MTTATAVPLVPWPERLLGQADLHAPHLIDVELTHALGGMVRGGRWRLPKPLRSLAPP